MAQPKLSRRRYGIATKALNELINSKQTGTARRLRAIELLLNLYERHDRAEERRERDEARKAAGLPLEPTEEMPETPDATEAARRFLENVRVKTEVNTNGE